VDTAIPPTAGTILREFPRTEYSMTGQGQQIMVCGAWGTLHPASNRPGTFFLQHGLSKGTTTHKANSHRAPKCRFIR